MYVPQTSRPAEAVLTDTGVGLSLLQAPRRLYLGQRILDQSRERYGVLRTLLAMPMSFRMEMLPGATWTPTQASNGNLDRPVPPKLRGWLHTFPLSRTNILEPIHKLLSDNIRSIRGVWALHPPRNSKNRCFIPLPTPKVSGSRPSAHFPVSTSPQR